MGGCTECGGKERCDGRKHVMFAAIDDVLARLYPTRRWGERDDAAAFGAGIGEQEGRALAADLAVALGAATVYRRGGEAEYCDYVYVLCLGREPSLVQLRQNWEEGRRVALPERPGVSCAPLRELHLRVCLSNLARMAAVQETRVELEQPAANRGPSTPVLRERPRSGVWDAPLLPRMRKLVAALAARDILHLDFGDLTAPPAGFDPGAYMSLWGVEPDLVSYLFYPQPSTSEVATLLAPDPG